LYILHERVKAVYVAHSVIQGVGMKRVAVLAVLLVTGCSTVKVKPLDIARHNNITKVCIVENHAVNVPDIVDIIENGFNRHNIKTEAYSGTLPETCLYNLTYSADRYWDVVFFMKHAELRLKAGNLIIASATYHNGGWFDLGKYASTESKLNPIIDELLEQYP
jgi:hypothetical protein